MERIQYCSILSNLAYIFQTVIIYFLLRIMASKWDDEFDFDNEIDKKKGKTDNKKKNRNSANSNEDYQDLDDTKKVKLPTIAKPMTINTQKSNKSSSNINLVEINKKKEQTGTKTKIKNYQEDEQQQFQQSIAPNPSQFKQKNEKVPSKDTIQVQEKEAENSYGNQEFEEENYEQDFQATQVKKQSPVLFKAKEDSKKQSKVPVALPKPPQKQKRAAESTAKRNQIVAKGNSRTSVRSQSASRTSKSQNKPQQKKEDPPNKYVSLAQKNCQDYQRGALQQLSVDKIVRENDKIRNMIKKFNDELNDLINKNIMQLKSKKEEKTVNIDEVLKLLEEQKSSNQIAYQNTVKDLQRLKGKQGQLKEEQYQLTIDQKIIDAKVSMTQISKAIVKLKQQVNNEGNKLSKIDKQKDGTTNSQQINTIKNNIVLVRKQEEKNDQTLSKLYIKVEELTKKMSDADYKLNGQLQQAKQKGISVQLNSEITKRYEQNKKKIENAKQHKSKTEALFKTKCEMISHECDQIKASMKLIENSLSISTSNCEEIKIQIKRILEKAKKNTKMPQDLIKNLENMISDLQNGVADQATFTHPKGAKKYQSQKNVEKISALSITAQRNSEKSQKQKLQQEIVSIKPAIFKKKQKQEQKQDERVWKDDKNTEVKKTQRISQSIPELARFEQKEENQKKQQERKKPFMIKRNKQTIKTPELDNGVESLRAETKHEKIQIKKEVEKEDQRPNIAPRMMKFKKNKPEQGLKQQEEKKNYETIEKPQQKIVIQQKLQEKIEEKQAQSDPQKPIFAPKRFNLKIKDKKTEDQGYVATTVKKQQPPKVIEQFKPKGLTVDKQPIFSSQNIQPVRAQPVKLTVQEDQKPKFNLRLRDRQRESKKPQQSQMPQPQSTKQPQQKISISLTDKTENLSKQNNNPYSNPYANAEVPKREKQGPLKKQKPVQSNAKQNFNIYDQAEDLTNVKQIKIGGQSPKIQTKAAQVAEPSLQQLLGIKKNKNQVDPDLILDNKIIEGRKKEVKSKKDTNFFGDLQL